MREGEPRDDIIEERQRRRDKLLLRLGIVGTVDRAHTAAARRAEATASIIDR